MFKPKQSLEKKEIRQGLNKVVYDGLMTQIMVVLTGGIFLVDFALKMGASNYLIGLIAAISPLAQLAQIPGIYLIEKFRKRKLITIIAASFARMFLLLIILIPFIIPPQQRVLTLFIALLLNGFFASIGGCSWNSWMHSLIPHRLLGTFFSRRMFFTTSLGIIFSLLASVFIDKWEILNYPILQGYSLMFFVGFIFGIIGILFLFATPEVKMPISTERLNLFKLISTPFKDKNFRQLLTFLGAFTFSIQLAVPFFSVYMLKKLGLSLSFIIILSVINQVTMLLFLRVWGKFSDKFSNKSVLYITVPFFLFTILLWTFTTLPEKHILTIPLLIVIHIISGFSLSGVTLATSNIALKLSPSNQATSYLASVSIVNSIMASIAPIIGGFLADIFVVRELTLSLRWISPIRNIAFNTISLKHYDFLFLISFILGIYSLHRLATIVEKGEITEKISIFMVLSEAKKQARAVSTIGGIRYMVHFPFAVLTEVANTGNKIFKRFSNKTVK